MWGVPSQFKVARQRSALKYAPTQPVLKRVRSGRGDIGIEFEVFRAVEELAYEFFELVVLGSSHESTGGRALRAEPVAQVANVFNGATSGRLLDMFPIVMARSNRTNPGELQAARRGPRAPIACEGRSSGRSLARQTPSATRLQRGLIAEEIEIMERLQIRPDLPYSDVEYAIHVARYLPIRDLVAGKTVLDACCGEGYASHILATQWGARSVVGVDISPVAIESANANFRAPGLSYVESSLEDYIERAIRSGEKYDLIASIETLEHVDDPAEVISGLRLLLKDDGIFYLTIPNDAFYFGAGDRSLNKYHKHMFDFEMAKRLTEDILGPGDWALGTVANGFSTVRMSDVRSKTYFSSDIAVTSSTARSIPVSPANALTPASAIYYAGLWTVKEKASIVSSTALFPAGSDFRIQKLSIRAPSIDGRPI